MSTKVVEQQLYNLNREMALLRSVVIGVIGEKDPEGAYRPEFVARILEIAKTEQRGVKFTTPAALLKIIS